MNTIANILMSPHFVTTTIILALALTAVICLVQLIRTPPFLKRRFDRAVRRCGLHNALKEYPTFICVRRDPNENHGLILKIKNVGVTVPDFDAEYVRLKITLRGDIYHMEDDKDTDYTLLWFLPQRHLRPAILDPIDDAIGSIGINRLINMLIVGATGTGKTVAIKIIMAKIVTSKADAKIWLLDFKQFDFKGFSALPRYYGYADCIQGLTDYYDAFKQQQQLGIAAEPNYLICDEWGALLLSLNKKEAERCKAMLSELLMQGRAYGFYPIIGIQRPDSSYFTGGARDNFQCCLALGNLSKEGRRMVFPDDAVERLVKCRKREGHLYIDIDGMGLEKVRVADIADMKELDAIIRSGMSR